MYRSPALTLAAVAALGATNAWAACAPDVASRRDPEAIAREATAALARLDGEALEALLHPNATLYAATDGSVGTTSQVRVRLAEMKAGLPADLPPVRVTGVLAAGQTVAVRISRRWPGAAQDVEGLMAFNIEAGCVVAMAIMG